MTKSSLVRTGSLVGASKPNFLFILYRPTAPKSYFFVEKNILSINFCAISIDGASPALSCLYNNSRASSEFDVGSLAKVLANNSTAILFCLSVRANGIDLILFFSIAELHSKIV